jgi:hypothetical protein
MKKKQNEHGTAENGLSMQHDSPSFVSQSLRGSRESSSIISVWQ